MNFPSPDGGARIAAHAGGDGVGSMIGTRIRTILRWTTGALGVAAAGYALYFGTAWARYGQAAPPDHDAADLLLDRFIPTYEVAERHHIRVAAPGEITFAAAQEMDLNQSWIVRAIFRARELVLGAEPDAAARPRGIVGFATSIGWGVLAEAPGRELVIGAVTQPWNANVVFRALPPDEFAAFNEPGYVKIVWTLRADPVDAAHSIFRTETRAIATDPRARRKFRRYWSFLSPGIIVIRWMSLGPLKADAERRAKGAVGPGVARAAPRGELRLRPARYPARLVQRRSNSSGWVRNGVRHSTPSSVTTTRSQCRIPSAPAM
jgi:hypothetical protein